MRDLDPAQLRAFAVTVAEGTLDAAATALRVTPSAISQRLKALETATGAVLLVRSKPVRVTEAGQVVLRLARQLDLLYTDAARSLDRDGAIRSLPLAINADSLATWALPALAALADRYTFDIHREDESHPAMLRAGSVMAAITSLSQPVPGCRVSALGGMRYRPMATPEFAARYFAGGVTAATLRRAPVVQYDREDLLQNDYLRRHRVRPDEPPLHYVPSSADYLRAVAHGFGWGMLPDQQLPHLPTEDAVIDLDRRGARVVWLFWQQWQLESTALQEVTAAVTTAARAALSPYPRRGTDPS